MDRLGAVFVIGFSALVLGVGIIRFVRWAAPRPRDPALDELRARYARGEIDDAEYEASRRVLGG